MLRRGPCAPSVLCSCILVAVCWSTFAGPVSAGALHDRAGRTSHRADYDSANEKAQRWLKELRVDPVELIEHGVKGKKKLAEILDVYALLERYGAVSEPRKAFDERIEELAAHTSKPEYHNLNSCSDAEFRQNSMSYLRVLWLLQQFHLDTEHYRAEVEHIKPRLDAHLQSRGAWQRAMFSAYYERFELAAPPILKRLRRPAGVVQRRIAIGDYDRRTSYQLTHEVFVAFDYGLARDQGSFRPKDKRYLESVLPELAARNLESNDPDLLAELLSAMTYLDLDSEPVHQAAIEHLLATQNPNGSWGSYEYARRRFGDYVDQHLYLHTTGAVLRALVEAHEDEARI